MKIQVNTDLCTGCGTCVNACLSGVIDLKDGLAVLDKTLCTECEACVDTCPSGAITAVHLAVAVMKPTVIRLTGENEITIPESVPSAKPWLRTALALAGSEILPRLVDILITTLDRRLTQPAQAQVYPLTQNAELVLARNSRQGERRQRRRCRGRWYGTNKN